jgi:hypothetical protein
MSLLDINTQEIEITPKTLKDLGFIMKDGEWLKVMKTKQNLTLGLFRFDFEKSQIFFKMTYAIFKYYWVMEATLRKFQETHEEYRSADLKHMWLKYHCETADCSYISSIEMYMNLVIDYYSAIMGSK